MGILVALRDILVWEGSGDILNGSTGLQRPMLRHVCVFIGIDVYICEVQGV